MTKRSTTIRDKHRAAIARSRPPCSLCGNPIDYSLIYPHEQSYVVDHVIPLDAGGTDTIDNKQPAHRACNSAKGARLIPPTMRLTPGLNRP